MENKSIFRITTPYKDIFTTVYVIKTEKGVLLFDAASYDCDADDAIIPALASFGGSGYRRAHAEPRTHT